MRGKKVTVPCVQVQGRTVAITGKWLKIASIFDEEAIDGDVIKEPESFLRDLAARKCGADIFTFAQRIPDTQPKYSYPHETDNSAAVAITTYEEWLKKIGTDVKQNVKKSAKRGVEVTLILPGHSDSWLAYYAGRSYYEDLLEAGVRIYERRNRVLHAKSATVDGVWATVGSSNLDWRSLLYNDEINVVVLGPDFAGGLNEVLRGDLAASDEITREAWAHRPLDARAKEAAARAWARLL